MPHWKTNPISFGHVEVRRVAAVSDSGPIELELGLHLRLPREARTSGLLGVTTTRDASGVRALSSLAGAIVACALASAWVTAWVLEPPDTLSGSAPTPHWHDASERDARQPDAKPAVSPLPRPATSEAPLLPSPEGPAVQPPQVVPASRAVLISPRPELEPGARQAPARTSVAKKPRGESVAAPHSADEGEPSPAPRGLPRAGVAQGLGSRQLEASDGLDLFSDPR